MPKFMKWTSPYNFPPKQKVYAIAGTYDVTVNRAYPPNVHRVIFDAEGNVHVVFKQRRISRASHPIWLPCQCMVENELAKLTPVISLNNL